MLPELVQNLVYDLNVSLSGVFSIDQNIIRVYDDKYI